MPGARLYLLDEPIAGVDPAAREFILRTILTNYNENGTVLISTHLILDVEQVLDEAVFLQQGQVVLHESTDSPSGERTGGKAWMSCSATCSARRSWGMEGNTMLGKLMKYDLRSGIRTFSLI